MVDVKRTYRAATAFTAPINSIRPFFFMKGSDDVTVRLQRIITSGINKALIPDYTVILQKTTAVVKGEGRVTLTSIPNDTTLQAAKSICYIFTGIADEPAVLGTFASRTHISQATIASQTGGIAESVFDFRIVGEADSVVLTSENEGVCMSFQTALATQCTFSIEAEWTEE